MKKLPILLALAAALAPLLRRVGGEVEVMQQPSLLDKARSAV